MRKRERRNRDKKRRNRAIDQCRGFHPNVFRMLGLGGTWSAKATTNGSSAPNRKF